jgi:type II secretory pathway component GspD/PulD (secretin)
MRTLRQALSLFLAGLLLCAPSFAQSPAIPQMGSPGAQPDLKRARKAAEQGGKAEAAGRLGEALAAYEEAARHAPQDANIVARAASLRSKLVRAHVDAAERDALAGYFDQATDELAAALVIDPGNAIVAERLGQLKSMEEEQAPRAASEISGLPRLKPKSGKRNIDLRGDTKTVYEQLADLFGVTASFDPDLMVRNVHLRLDDVDFNTAVSVLAAQTGTFWRPLNPVMMFVAADTPEKRRQYALEAEQTFPLSAAVGPEDVTEVLRILRDITGSTHINLDSHSHTITIRDTPERLALAGALIQQIERARGEVMLEIELLEVDRSTAQKLGIEPPSKVQLFSLPPNLISQLNQATNISALQTLLAGIFGGAATGGTTSISSLIPPLIAVGGGKTTFLLTLPGAAADFSDALSLVQSGRQVLLRAQDGKPATFFVGDRFPVTLSLLSGSLGTSGFTPNPGGASNPFPSTSFAAGVGPVALVAADFENNGLLDLAAVNEIDNTVTILLNQSGSQGTFVQATGSPISLGTARTAAPLVPPGIASAVLTSSGFHDLLVTDPTGDAVDILISNGDGTFSTPLAPIPVGHAPSAIVTADFNNDGIQDFAVLNFSDNTLSVFLGGPPDAKGNPTFAAATGSPFALPTTVTGPIAMTVADFNGDGIPDLAIVTVNQATLANPATTTGSVVILQGDNNGSGKGTGTFTEFPGSPLTVGNLPVAIASGDLAGSARADLAVVNQTDASVTILLNNGNGTFVLGPNSPLTTASTPTGIALADFNQDGHVDIAVTSKDANTFRVFLGVSAGLFTLAFEPPAGPNGTFPTAIVAANFVNGGFPDVAITNNIAGAAGDVTVVLSPANLFSSLGNSSNVQQPYPGSEYVDLGVKIKATPTLHPKNEVTLQLEFEIRALSGSSVNGIPVISNRTLSQTVRVTEDEPTLLGGLTDREETRAITGLPGFAEIPAARYAFASRNNSLQDTELLIVITPRRLRMPEHLTRTIFAGRDIGARGPAGQAFPQPPPPQPQPQFQPPPPQPQPLPQPPPQPPPQP